AGPVVIEYEIRDAVNNWSLWSQRVETIVEVGKGLLLAPDALDAVDDAIDLARLGDNDARVRIRSWDAKAKGDLITLFWRAHSPQGTLIEHSQPYTVGKDEEGVHIILQVPNSIAKASVGSTAVISYTVRSIRDPEHSRRRSVQIVGQAQQLPVPIVQEAKDDTLDPENVPDSGATVLVPAYPTMRSGDVVELYCQGTTSDGTSSSHFDKRDITGGQVGRPVNFSVPKIFFQPLVGSLRVYYRVNGEDSEHLSLRVVGQGGGELPVPGMTDVQGGVLDPDSVGNSTLVVVPQYPGKAIDDRITLNWQGLAGASYSDYIDVTANNRDTPVSFPVDKAPYIIGNLNSTVRVHYQVRRASGAQASSKVLPFEVRRKVGEN
ncbi:MAG: hypothetical protein ACRESP_19040, partial [Pseudomonas sp.]